ncbi:MAG: DUF438 domain-containing protein [Parafannyhessea umbonata]|uniref:DUF438 domain-containing protein n=1 Tax=Parafannyhessea umbonata TaxID=604330 RepID=UPI0026ECAA97|nr:DUF438 domain-containing protein [Parafannyhessea umbonata]MDD6566448.1 DUF438 domain-containing protein [Parafannyhessea umbonata]
MARTIDLSRTVHDLVADNPEVATIMRDLGFADIAKPMALETVGRVMTIPRGAQIKGIDLASVVEAFEAAGFEVTGKPGAAPATPAPTGEKDAAAGAADGAGAASDAAGASTAAAATDEAGRARLLSSYVRRLSAGEDLESVRREFVANFSDVDAAEIARAEQGLIEGGTKVEDVQRLCDVHSALFHGATREERVANAEAAVMESIAGGSGKDDFKTRVLAALKGHPVNVLTLENKAIVRQVAATQQALDAGDDAAAAREVALLAQVGGHYAKKGDLLYPVLKVRHGYSGPADVMWGVDDEIRDELRALSATEPDARGSWHDRAVAVVRRADEMCYKEANILLPLCVRCFTEQEWLQCYVDLRGYEPCMVDPAEVGRWGEGEKFAATLDARATLDGGDIALPTGTLSAAQLDAVLNTIPMELTFVDEKNINRYWNDDGDVKLFKRPASALGREVWSCHPPKAEYMVRNVIDMLRSGQRDSVDVWMQKKGEPVLVRYMAVRDREGAYLGTLECVQPMGFARDHFAEG